MSALSSLSGRAVSVTESARGERALAVTALVAAIAAPFFLEGFQLFRLSNALVFAIALLGLNLLIGWSGQISLGHGAFMAAGAYVCAFLIVRWGLPYGLAIIFAVTVCFVLGILVGLPALRFEGHYLALCTFALAVAAPQILKSKLLDAYTGGVGGLVLKKPLAPFGLPLTPDQWLYLLGLGIFLLCAILMRNLARGRIGSSLIALRDHPTAAVCMGVDVARFKTLAFGISAGLGGLAGAYGAVLVQFVAPDTYTIMLSITLLVGVVVGGLGLLGGAIYGAAFIQFVPDLAESLSKAAPWAVYAALVIAVVVLAPTGAAGLVRKLLVRIENYVRQIKQ